MIYKLQRNIIPICFISTNEILAYRFGKILVINVDSKHIIASYSIKRNFKESVLARVPLLFRLFRLGVRIGIKIDCNLFIFNISDKIFEFNISNSSCSHGYQMKKGIRPLNFAFIKNIKGFDDMVVFGEYLSNSEKAPVSILRRSGTDKWIIIYTFLQNEINHIHNIIPDVYQQCVWILTGDFGDSAAIWKATNNFTKVEKVLFGSQDYRSCVAFPTSKGLIYATDTPFEQNRIYLCVNEDNCYYLKEVGKIHGSCIYGCKFNEKYVFSTAVEGDGRFISLWYVLFGRKRGLGIIDNYSHVYYGDPIDGFKDIYKVPKDRFPFVLFQFGVLRFPTGINVTKYLPIYHVATTYNNLSTILLKIK